VVKGLELSVNDGDSDGHEIWETVFQQELILIFEAYCVVMTKLSVQIIKEFGSLG